MVDFYEDELYDPITEKFYRGIVVTAYISKGAESTWEKVIDGTLSGFSIGGKVLDDSKEFVKDANKTIRFIKEYDLIELSLVDNPANRLANVEYVAKANVFTIESDSDGKQVMKGMIADVKSEVVYYCPTDEVAKSSTESSLNCPNCGNQMTEIGLFEYDNDSERTEKFAGIVNKYLASNNNTQVEPANTEGGVDVAKGTETKAVTDEDVKPEPVIDPVAQGEAETEANSSVESDATDAEVSEVEASAETDAATADVTEVEDGDKDLEKMFSSLQTDFEKKLDDNLESVRNIVKSATEALPALQTQVSEVEARLTELNSRYEGLTEKFNGMSEKLAGVEKSLSVVDGATAIKKSGDLGGSSETVEKAQSTSPWGGHFLGVNHLTD
jgi:archaellum component FlaC